MTDDTHSGFAWLIGMLPARRPLTVLDAEILCFTDPFCSWCSATEASLLTLRERYRDQLAIRWVMGGLVTVGLADHSSRSAA